MSENMKMRFVEDKKSPHAGISFLYCVDERW